MEMDGRRSPTIVIEVGYSETLEKLRFDARRWLTVDAEATAEKCKRNGRKQQRPVMLVILMSFEGKRPSEVSSAALDESVEEEEVQKSETGRGRKKLSIFVKLWRNRSEPVLCETSSSIRTTAQLKPVRCERKRSYRSPEDGEANDYITLFATDLFGEKVVDPGGLQRWNIPLSVFGDAYMLALRTWGGAAEKDGNDDDDVVFVTDSPCEEREEHGEYQQEYGAERKKRVRL